MTVFINEEPWRDVPFIWAKRCPLLKSNCFIAEPSFEADPVVDPEEDEEFIDLPELDGELDPEACLSLKKFVEAFARWEYKWAKGMALYKLNRRAYLSTELKKALRTLGASEGVAAQIIAEFQEKGFLNEKNSLESVVRQAIRQLKGPMWVAQHLHAKGADPAHIKLALKEHYTPELRQEIIKKLVSKQGKKDHQKQIASIARRGFALQDILAVCGLYDDN